MILDDLGLGTGNITISGATAGMLAWMWRKMSGVESKVSEIELKVAENYVTRPEFKILEEKLDKHNEVLSTKIDNVSNNLSNKFDNMNNNLLTLTNLLVKNR